MEKYQIKANKNPQRNNKIILVLGAGASAGSQYAEPPLIKDFFYKADALGIPKKRGFKPLWIFLKNNLGLDLPQILSEEKKGNINIEQIYSLTSAIGEDEIKKLLERFLHRTLTETTNIYKNKSCNYHNRLLTCLNPTAIISFNYDLIIGKSLATIYENWEKSQIKKFDKVYDGKNFIESIDILESFKITKKNRFPILFKLHGSLNHYYDVILWEQTRARHRWVERTTSYIVPLKYAFNTQRIYKSRHLRDYAPSTLVTGSGLYDNQKADLKLNLTPPIYNKTPHDWDEVLLELKNATKIIFIGYSLPDIDLWAIRLFRRAYQKHRYKNELIIEVINPDDRDIISKIKSIYYSSNVSKAANTIKEYAEKLTTDQINRNLQNIDKFK